MQNPSSEIHGKGHCFLLWAQRVKLVSKLTVILIIAAISSVIATYGAITQSSNPFGPDPRTVVGLVLIDLSLLLALLVIIGRRLIKLWIERRRGSVGSRLQTRIVLMFSLVSVVPTIIVAVFSTLFFNYGIQSWFDTRVGTAVEESVAVAEAYLKEHKSLISADAWAMSAELSRASNLYQQNADMYQQLLSKLARERYLTDAVIFQSNNILAKTSLSFSEAFERLPLDAVKKAAEGNVVVLKDDGELVRALIKLEGFVDPYKLDQVGTFLLIGRLVDNKVINHLKKTQGAATEYKRLQQGISNTQINFSIVFILVALLLLFVAAWLGLIFAVTIARPISAMVAATDRIKEGDLEVQIEEGPVNDEIGTLTRAFNRMTQQLGKQRSELINVNHQIDERRHFIETVLSGVSAGVIALGSDKRITLFNPSAIKLLSHQAEVMHGAYFSELLPEMLDMLTEAEKSPGKAVDGQVEVVRESGRLTLLVRIAAERLSEEIEGYVITFDDVSELLSAQRRAAWSDVARRIAHEIKNPLTPIQLATERLSRKYSEEVSDSEGFNKYTDTIIRHVDSIGKMVEEFANFARMPLPVFAKEDLRDIVQNTVFSRKCLEQGIVYDVSLPDDVLDFYCDAGQIVQVLTNILKNAEEAVLAYLETLDEPVKGCIKVSVSREDNTYVIVIHDNGPGFPTKLMDRLTEPYITTRSKGTGLGLAIVKKIIEDHGGILELANDSDGAKVTITFMSKGIE